MKKNVLRVICFVMAACMCLGLVSCAGFAAKPDSSAPSESGENVPITPPTPPIDYSKGLADNGYWDGVKALDFVTLPQYKGVAVPTEEITPTAEDLAAFKEQVMQPYGTPTKITEGEAKSGDTVNIDYVGTVDGVEFSGGNTNGQGADLTLGSGQYIPGFEDQLVGKKVGDKVEVKVTFPADYNASTDKDGNEMILADKEAIFTTTINHIVGEMEFPELNDAFVADKLQGQYGWKTVAQLEEGYMENMTRNNKYVWMESYLNDNATVSEVPTVILDTIVYQQMMQIEMTMGMYGVPMDEYVKNAGFETKEDFAKSMYDDENLQNLARLYLIYQAIAETESIVPDQDMANELLKEQAEQIKAQCGDQYLMQVTMNQAVVEFLDKNN